MRIVLKADAKQFVEEQVRAGRFGSADDMVEEAVRRMMLDWELDDDTVAAINRAEEQLDRREGVEFDQFAAEMRRDVTKR